MRNGNGIGSFIVGVGLGTVLGVAMNRWMDKSNFENNETSRTSSIKLDRQDIAQLAEQFMNTDDSQQSNVTTH